MKQSKRIALCKVTDIPANGIKQVKANGKDICVLNGGSQFFACQAQCPHEKIPLCEGIFDGETLTCVEHLWQWSVVDNGETRGLAETRLEMYDVEIDAGTVYLKG